MRTAPDLARYRAACASLERSARAFVAALSRQGYAKVTAEMSRAKRATLAPSTISELRRWDAWLRVGLAPVTTHPLFLQRHWRIASAAGLATPYEVRFEHDPSRAAILICADYVRLLENVLEAVEQRRTGR
jgi:hypothetical protein